MWKHRWFMTPCMINEDISVVFRSFYICYPIYPRRQPPWRTTRAIQAENHADNSQPFSLCQDSNSSRWQETSESNLFYSPEFSWNDEGHILVQFRRGILRENLDGNGNLTGYFCFMKISWFNLFYSRETMKVIF